jgi:N-acetylmuramoyl-L-alanine amidase
MLKKTNVPLIANVTMVSMSTSPHNKNGLNKKSPVFLSLLSFILSFSLGISLSLAFILLPSAELWAAGELGRARAAREAFFNGEDTQKRASWLKLISQFEAAIAPQVKDTWRAVARLETAELSLQSFYKFREQKDAQKAEVLTRAVIKDCGRCEQAPKAVILLGRALTAQKRMDDAYRELMKVELNYPDAPETEEARELMSTLRAGATPPPIPTPQPILIPLNATSKVTSTTSSTINTASASSGQKSSDTSFTKDTLGTNTQSSQSDSQKESTIASKEASAITAKAPIKAPKARSDGLAQVYALSLEDHGDYSTVIAFSDAVTTYVYNLIPPQRSGGAYRVYVDIRDAKLGPNIPMSLKKTTPLVKLLKVNQFNDKTVRVVMDLPDAYPYIPVFLDNPPRMVVQIAKNSYALPDLPIIEAPPTQKSKSSATSSAVIEASTRPPMSGARGPAESMARQLGLKIKRIVLDPGHGGKDTGASGYGLKEKDIALKTAIKLKNKLEKRLKIEVILTRDTDKFVTLDRRPKIVKDNNGDLFISIHANANNLSSVEGLETYILNFTQDPSAQTVAARENASSDKSMSEMNNILELIAKNTKVSESRVLAKTIHSASLKSIRTKYKVRDLGVKEAVFVVLVNVKVPSILMEIGFLTNKNEASRLSEDEYLELLTDGMADGIKNYIEGLPH